MTNDIPKTFPGTVRLLLAVLAIVLIGFTFKVMSHLTAPSIYVHAVKIVEAGPQTANNINNLAFLNFKNYLYLEGPIYSATSDQEAGPLFLLDQEPVMAPSTFTDASSSLEILAQKLPLIAEDARTYRYQQSYHLLGWRVGPAGFSLFAMGETKASLLTKLKRKASGWKTSMFGHGLALIFLVLIIFWLLNMSLLSTPYLEIVQILIVNLVFLILFYSVLLLAGYPLLETVMITVKILLLANIVFVPILHFIRKKKLLN